MTQAGSLSAPREGANTLAGIGMMLLGIFLFATNDALGKWLVGTYSVGQVLLFRSLAALAVLAPFIWARRRSFRSAPRPGLQLFRMALSTVEVACFYGSVALLPLADAMTFYLAGPIYVTALSAIFLAETVGWRRWTAVLAGFLGVILALEPASASLSLGALLAIVGSFAFACLMIATRKLAGTDATVLVTTQFLAALLLGAVVAPFQWVPPRPIDIALIGLVGIVSLGAYLCVNYALKLAPASLVVPYQYTIIVWAIIYGYLVFGDVPGLGTLLGAGIIAGAGLFIFLRERAAARGEALPAAAAAPPEF